MKYLIMLFTVTFLNSLAFAGQNPCSQPEPSNQKVSPLSSLHMAGGGGGSGGSTSQIDQIVVGEDLGLVKKTCLLVDAQRFQDLVIEAGTYSNIEIDGKILKPTMIDFRNKSIIVKDENDLGEQITIGIQTDLQSHLTP